MSSSAREKKERRNVELIRKMVGWLNDGEYETYLRHLTDDFFWKSDALLPFPGQMVGKHQVGEWLVRATEILPGFRFEIEQVFPSHDVVTLIGTASGDGFNGFMGLPARNLPWQHQYCLIYFLTEEGDARGLIYFYDGTILLKRLGQMPNLSIYGLPPVAQWPPWHGRVDPPVEPGHAESRPFDSPAGDGFRGAEDQSFFTDEPASAHPDPASGAMADLVQLPLTMLVHGARSLLGFGHAPKHGRQPSSRWD